MKFSVNLDMRDRRVLVVGGGTVGKRKIAALIDTGAKIEVVSPEVLPDIEKWQADGKLIWRKRAFRSEDIRDKEFVFCTTNQREMNQEIARLARQEKAWVNVSDCPFEGNLFIPASYQQGNLRLTVSTDGESPGVARQVRQKLEEDFGPEWAEYLELIRRLREEFKEMGTPKEREQFWRKILQMDFVVMIKEGQIRQVEGKIRDAARSFRA